MTAEQDAADVLAQVVPLGDDTVPEAFTDSVVDDIARRRAEAAARTKEHMPPFSSAPFSPLLPEWSTLQTIGPVDVMGVVRPGDVLVFTIPLDMSMQRAVEMREAIMQRLPGLRDVVLMPFVLTAIYRGEPTTVQDRGASE